jgi:hypothetical protein
MYLWVHSTGISRRLVSVPTQKRLRRDDLVLMNALEKIAMGSRLVIARMSGRVGVSFVGVHSCLVHSTYLPKSLT